MTAEKEIINLPRFNEKVGLERTREVLFLLGLNSPHYPWIHIAGSKGKGSTAMMLAKILECSGYNTGLFISPHVTDIKERITINSSPIDSLTFNNAYKTLKDKLRSKILSGLTFFEIMTILATMIFTNSSIEVAVIETGLGGRLDPTNAIDNSTLSIITPIELEHTRQLGDTIAKIATEKAGIIRSKTPVLMSNQELGAAGAIQEIAIKKSSKFYSLEQLAITKRNADFNSGVESFTLNSSLSGKLYKNVIVNPRGAHQVNNAAVSVIASELLNKEGFIISDKCIREGLKKVSIPCRFESIIKNNKQFILDGAHTVKSAMFTVQTFKEFYKSKKVPIIYGSKKNKNVKEILSILSNIASEFFFTEIPGIGSFNPEVLLSILNDLNFSGASYFIDINNNPEFVFKNNNNQFMLTGSIILAGYYRTYLLS
ncbi:MAG: hypothetical protein KAH01_01125 [Caldisericia bacterium]|nr:hypothetical protein [Caldisericia bacterium]